nr:SEC-C metal-binding domain-containing protein [Clostridium yunnanense]
MDADALYINVYRNDTRANKELLPNNKNFVCFIDYNISGETTLEHGGLPVIIWNKLYHEKLEKIQIAWRDGIFAIKKSTKIGRNDLCPCKSGKKYKKCCGSKL